MIEHVEFGPPFGSVLAMWGPGWAGPLPSELLWSCTSRSWPAPGPAPAPRWPAAGRPPGALTSGLSSSHLERLLSSCSLRLRTGLEEALSSPRLAAGQSAVLVPIPMGRAEVGRDELSPGPVPAPCPSSLMSPGCSHYGGPRRQSQGWSDARGLTRPTSAPSLIPQMLLCHLNGKWVSSWHGRGLPGAAWATLGACLERGAQIP